MTLSDLFKSVADTARERSATPLTGALILSWLVWNWRVILVLLSSKSVEWKISYIDFLIYDGGSMSYWYYFVGPILTAMFLLLLYPLPSIAIYRVWAFYQRSFIAIEQKLRSERLVSREEFNNWQRQASEEYAENENRIKRKDSQIEWQQIEIKTVSDQAAVIDARNKELEKKINEILATEPVKSDLGRLLLNGKFVLVFQPTRSGDGGSKSILFGPDGAIIKGKNKNESTWRFANGFLELLDSTGVVHNRFYYHPGQNEFLAVEDENLPAVQGQRIYQIF